MVLENISYERLQEIEQEREITQQDPKFQSWMHQLNVGRLYVNRDGIVKANQMMENWTMNSLNKTH
jgi:hypothetical protein